MRLQTRIFTVAFTISSLLLVFSALVSFTVAASREQVDTQAATAALHKVSLVVAPEEEDAQAMTELKGQVRSALVPLRRELAGGTLLAEDRTIRSVAVVAAMVVAGAFAAFVISTVAARGLTARWRRIGAGIASLLAGDRSIRFSGSSMRSRDEFSGLELALDSMLDALEESSRIAQEFRALQSWGEAAAFLARSEERRVGQ